MPLALQELLRTLPGNLSNHLLISLLPLLLGLSLSIPIAIFAVRNKRLRYPVLTVVSIVQTIPSLALLALMVPVLVAIGGLTARWLGFGFSALGFYPTVVALTLYSMLPMVRNTVTGILEVDPALKEAARGVGMTPWQSLRIVELPLALPVIIAGIRTATVWTVGIATLATPVGQRCLGNYIFAGLQTRNWTMVLFGCIAAALLAVVLDLLIGGIQQAVEHRNRILGWSAGLSLGALVVCGLIAPPLVDWLYEPGIAVTARDREEKSAAQQDAPLIIGSKTFTEQYLLQDLIARRLARGGFETEQRESLGSTVIFNGITTGEVDCYVDYTGTIWANYMDREKSAAPWKVYHQVAGWLAREHGVRCLGKLGYENPYVLAMKQSRAEELGIDSIRDLAEHASDMSIGSDYEFFSRPEWKQLRNAYGLAFADRVTYNSTFMYEALQNGEVDVIAAFASDGRINAYDLQLLDDPLQVIPPYDAVILLSPSAAERPGVAAALGDLLGAIDLRLMRQANYKVDRDRNKSSIPEAASWLNEQIKQDTHPESSE